MACFSVSAQLVSSRPIIGRAAFEAKKDNQLRQRLEQCWDA